MERVKNKESKKIKEFVRGKEIYLMFAPIINLLLAEVASYFALEAFFKSPFVVLGSKYYALETIYPFVMAIPLLLLILKRNPFSFGYFYFLILIVSGNILAKSELFYAWLDVLYFLKLGNLASYLNSVFSSAKGIDVTPVLLDVVWLFVLSQLIWISAEKGREMEERGMSAKNLVLFQWAFAFIFTYVVYLVYPSFVRFDVGVELPLIMAGIVGIAMFIVVAVILSR